MLNHSKINSIAILGLLVFIVLQIVAYRAATVKPANVWTNQHQTFLKTLSSVNSLNQDLEIELRDFLFFSKVSTVFPLDNTSLKLMQDFKQLTGIDLENRQQQDRLHLRLKPLLLKNIALSKKIVEIYQKHGIKLAIAEFYSPNNYFLSKEIKNILHEIESDERSHFEYHIQQDKINNNHLSLLIFTGSLISILFFSLLFFVNSSLLRKYFNQHQLLQSVLNCMEAGVLARDSQGALILTNPAAQKILDVRSSDKVISDIFERNSLYHIGATTPMSLDELPSTKALEGQSIDNMVLQFKSNINQRETFLSISARPLVTIHGKHIGGIVVARDISEEKKNYDELEAFSYSVSHDLSSPLHSIIGFTKIIAENKNISPESQDALAEVLNATNDMEKIISGLIELSRLSHVKLKLKDVNLSLLVQDSCSKLQERHSKHQIKFVIAENIMAKGDTQLLETVTNNLLNNAYKYSSLKSEAVIEFGVLKKNGQQIYFIRDNGVGFDMQFKEKLFKPFERLHSTQEFPGTGIGLATVERVIKRHGGKIWAESEINEGATFYFTLS